MAINKAQSPHAYGTMTSAQFHSRNALTTLASNTLVRSMPNTSPPSSTNITNACKIGTDNTTWEWTSTGTTMTKKYTYHAWILAWGTHLISTHNTKKAPAPTILTCNTNLRCKSTICGGRRHFPPPRQNGKNICSRGHRHVPILCMMCRQRYAHSPWLPGNATSKSNSQHNDKSEAILRLCSNPSGRHRPVSHQWHGPGWTQQRIVPVGI